MAYSKTSWTDGTTPVNASNMNKIEDALSDNASALDSLGLPICLTASFTDFNDATTGGIYYLSSVERDNEPSSLYHNGYLMVLSTGTTSGSYCFQLFFSGSNANIWFRRRTSSWQSWRSITNTAV